ncbi:MAG: biotin-dependent carboxyltransferase family protein [Acidobacteria bacterium]|nr:biotin-dependent carboxyltransferase family protein [Acidobacteriota bacterium]
MIEVLDPGPLALVEDLGRLGYAHLGVGPSGPADRRSFTLANRLVRNRADAVGIELLLGGFVMLARADLELAVCGTDSDVVVDGRAHGSHTSVIVSEGAEVAIGPPSRGLRNYLAVRGGLAVDAVLGSAATDTMSGLGPAPLRAGDLIALAATAPVGVSVDMAPVDLVGSEISVDLLPGPHREWFGIETDRFVDATQFEVDADSNRIGVRLSGAMQRRDGEIASEPMVRGALQVPPDGNPIALLADFPVTGGYPVYGIVDSGGIDRLAQARPGAGVRFFRRGWEG